MPMPASPASATKGSNSDRSGEGPESNRRHHGAPWLIGSFLICGQAVSDTSLMQQSGPSPMVGFLPAPKPPPHPGGHTAHEA